MQVMAVSQNYNTLNFGKNRKHKSRISSKENQYKKETLAWGSCATGLGYCFYDALQFDFSNLTGLIILGGTAVGCAILAIKNARNWAKSAAKHIKR